MSVFWIWPVFLAICAAGYIFMPMIIGLAGVVVIECFRRLRFVPALAYIWLSATAMAYVCGIWQMWLWSLASNSIGNVYGIVSYVLAGFAGLIPVASMLRHGHELKRPQYLFLEQAVCVLSWLCMLPLLIAIVKVDIAKAIWPFVNL